MTRYRSWLFVPGDNERKVKKALQSDADVVILDLEDAVAPGQKALGRELVKATVKHPRTAGKSLCVRINPPHSEEALADLEALSGHLPALLMLPKLHTAADCDWIGEQLGRIESASDLTPAHTKVIALVTETAAMTASLPSLTSLPSRIAGLTWGGEDLSTELGASANRDADGRWLPVFDYARVQCLLAAKRFGRLAIDTLYSDFRDSDGMRSHAANAERDGFDGVLAIHPAQIAPIHQAFTPSAERIAEARAVLEAFSQSPDAGAVQLDGKMLDLPHLTQAKRLLARAGEDA